MKPSLSTSTASSSLCTILMMLTVTNKKHLPSGPTCCTASTTRPRARRRSRLTSTRSRTARAHCEENRGASECPDGSVWLLPLSTRLALRCSDDQVNISASAVAKTIVVSLACGVKVLQVDGDRIVPLRSFPLAMDANANALHTWTLVGNFWYGVRMRGPKWVRRVDITTGVETKLPFLHDFDEVRPCSHREFS